MLRRLFVLLVVLLTLATITVPSCAIAEITNDNKKNLETILDNLLLGKNRFRVEDKSTATRYSQLRIGDIIFQAGVREDETHQMLDCYFVLAREDAKTAPAKMLKESSYFDVGCIGQLYKVTENNVVRDPTDGDKNLYSSGVLPTFATLVPFTKAFLADIPPSQPGAALDARLRASNKALLDTILKEMNASTITIVNPDGMQIFNMTGTGEIIVQLGATPDRSLCSVNVKMPGDDIMTFMDQCAGRIDRFVMNGGKREQADSTALDPVLNRILTDVERFTQFAAQMFPKNSQ